MTLRELMTFDFGTQGYTPDELIKYLIKFKYEYRVLESKLEQSNRILKEKSNEINNLTEEKKILQEKNNKLLNQIRRRKLSIWERISGKIK